MLLPALCAALVLVVLPVRVESLSCPSGAEVERALVSILPSMSEASRPDVALVTRNGAGLKIELVNPDAAVLAERTLDMGGSCADLAAVVAIVIAAWESDVHPEFTRSHAEPLLAGSIGRSLANPGTPLAGSLASYDMTMGASLSFANSFAAGGILAGTWISRSARWGIRLFGTGETSRTIDLGTDQARWRRWMGGLESDWRLAQGRAALDLHVGLALSWLAATGVNFSQNQSQLSFSPGATAGMRLSFWTTRHFALSLDLVGTYWSRRQIVYSAPLVTQRELPHFHGLASLGVTLGQSAQDR